MIAFLIGCIGLLALGGAYDALIADTHLVDLQAELEDGFYAARAVLGRPAARCRRFSVLLASGRGDAVAPRWIWGVFTVLFLEAATDETVAIHERLGNAAGIDWLVLYTPLFAVAGVLWLKVLRALEGRPGPADLARRCGRLDLRADARGLRLRRQRRGPAGRRGAPAPSRSCWR